jgi:hypothetical protein
MALTTYAALQTALIAALHRSDLNSAMPDFITLCEDRLNKRLRVRGMESRVTASVNSEYMALPTGFLSMKNFQLNTTPRTPLNYATPDFLDYRYPDTTQTGTPKFFSFVGGQIQLAPVPDITYTAELDFYKKLDIATDLTNWVLTNGPRCYYYGALMEASLYLKDEKRASSWATMFEAALKEIELGDDYDQIPDGDLVVRSDSIP